MLDANERNGALAPEPQTAGTALGELMAERYGENPPAGLGDGNAVIRSILGHRSVRAYTPEPIPEAVIAMMSAAAQSAASSSNMQLWSLVCVTDPERKSKLSKFAGDQKHIDEAPLLVVWLADLARCRQMAARENHPSEGLDYLESFVTAAIDAALAAQNAVVAVESLGYGTCYIGSIRSHPLDVAAELGLPPEVFPIFGLTVGRPRPDSEAAIKPRLPQTSVVHRERYGLDVFDRDLTLYNRVMSLFQASQGMRIVDWSLHTSRRIGSAASLKNRDKLKGYLETMGFKLR